MQSVLQQKAVSVSAGLCGAAQTLRGADLWRTEPPAQPRLVEEESGAIYQEQSSEFTLHNFWN